MQPSLEEWRALYEAAIAFRDAAPWQWMWDSDQFGVQDPESGQIAYGCVMGRLGEHFALAAYLGSDGLAGLWEMRMGGPPQSREPVDTLLLQHCLMASFEDRMPTPVKGEEENERPYFPQLILAADKGSGMILGMEMVKPGEAPGALAE